MIVTRVIGVYNYLDLGLEKRGRGRESGGGKEGEGEGGEAGREGSRKRAIERAEAEVTILGGKVLRKGA